MTSLTASWRPRAITRLADPFPSLASHSAPVKERMLTGFFFIIDSVGLAFNNMGVYRRIDHAWFACSYWSDVGPASLCIFITWSEPQNEWRRMLYRTAFHLFRKQSSTGHLSGFCTISSSIFLNPFENSFSKQEIESWLLLGSRSPNSNVLTWFLTPFSAWTSSLPSLYRLLQLLQPCPRWILTHLLVKNILKR